MEKHIVFEVMDDLGISTEKDATERSFQLGSTEVNNILDRMEFWYSTQSKKILTSAQDSIYDFWIPGVGINSFSQVTANLFFANSVILSDPLYDHLCLFDSHNLSRNVAMRVESPGKVCSTCLERLDLAEREIIRNNIANIFSFYLKSRPLIESGQLVPYISTQVGFVDEIPMDKFLSKYDREVKEFEIYWKEIFGRLGEMRDRTGHSVNDFSLPNYRQYASLMHEKGTALLAVDQILTNDNIPAPSIDFLGQISGGFLRGLIRFGNKVNKSKSSANYVTPFGKYSIPVPTLSGVSMQSIPEILDKEKDSLEQFKASLTSKISSIQEPYGTPTWELQVSSVRAELRKELIELNRTLKHIKQDHLKRQTENIFLGAFSISLASLALANQTLDPLTALQSVAGGSGLIASIRNVIDSWLDYQQKINEQKRRDVYFLWHLQQTKSKH